MDFSSLKLIGYDKTKMNDTENSQRFVHFFLDDYKFEVMWNNPEPRIDKLRQYRGVLSPQFSTYYTMPLALQLYNTFRSRWCGAYFQQHGLTVIPTISWGLPDSYDFCFEGIERGSIVAVSTIGVRDEKQYFISGYNEMMRSISPSVIICYGSPFPEMQGYIIPVNYVETNNLTPQEKPYQSTDDLSAYKFFCSPTPNPLSQYIIAAGMGGGSNYRYPVLEYKRPKSGSGKERATDVPSWAKGNRPYKHENGTQFAKRICDERYGNNNYPKGPRSDFNKIKKWGDRAFE